MLDQVDAAQLLGGGNTDAHRLLDDQADEAADDEGVGHHREGTDDLDPQQLAVTTEEQAGSIGL